MTMNFIYSGNSQLAGKFNASIPHNSTDTRNKSNLTSYLRVVTSIVDPLKLKYNFVKDFNI